MKNETIASISTPIGEGGIGVIQVSGPDSLEIVNKIFKGRKQKNLKKAESKRLYYGDVYSKDSIVDEVIVNILRKQDSFTGEDLVEVNCHGGIMAVKKTLECVVSAGAKKVHWKELTNRSLTNHKIDLIQNEALLEIPEAKTKLAVKVLLDQHNGALSSAVHETVEDIENYDNSKTRLDHINNKLKEILKSANFGCALTSPQKLIIAGKPNTGKSTLINALLKEDRLITHKEPGTTRDAIDEMISIDGIPLTIIDTAGIRETGHEVEKLGILESKKQLKQADKVILVFDNSKPLEKEDKELIEFINKLDLQRSEDTEKITVFPVINKTDLPCRLKLPSLFGDTFGSICQISALNADGLPVLEKKLVSEFKEFTNYTPERPIVFTKRQHKYLSKTVDLLNQFIRFFEEKKEPKSYSKLLNDIRQNLLQMLHSHNLT
ncbi:MAG: GTP-binding protein [Candidatus Brocadiaceae bacterium]|nr:GTP-binding protein [Candidatus Brocadiaceae bacterium]